MYIIQHLFYILYNIIYIYLCTYIPGGDTSSYQSTTSAEFWRPLQHTAAVTSSTLLGGWFLCEKMVSVKPGLFLTYPHWHSWWHLGCFGTRSSPNICLLNFTQFFFGEISNVFMKQLNHAGFPLLSELHPDSFLLQVNNPDFGFPTSPNRSQKAPKIGGFWRPLWPLKMRQMGVTIWGRPNLHGWELRTSFTPWKMRSIADTNVPFSERSESCQLYSPINMWESF